MVEYQMWKQFMVTMNPDNDQLLQSLEEAIIDRLQRVLHTLLISVAVNRFIYNISNILQHKQYLTYAITKHTLSDRKHISCILSIFMFASRSLAQARLHEK
jgi:hypothetical protein